MGHDNDLVIGKNIVKNINIYIYMFIVAKKCTV